MGRKQGAPVKIKIPGGVYDQDGSVQYTYRAAYEVTFSFAGKRSPQVRPRVVNIDRTQPRLQGVEMAERVLGEPLHTLG